MQNSYLIILQNNIISVAECEEGKLLFIKKNGEKELPYKAATFWEWFKEKIDYESEELSFIVLSDLKEFAIPKDIKIAKKSAFLSNSSCLAKIGQFQSGLHFLSFPKIDSFKPKKREKRVTKVPQKDIGTLTKTSIADIYIKETLEYKSAKK